MAFVYFHKYPHSLEVYYVGIGVNKRRLYSKNNRNTYWINTCNKYGFPVVDIVHDGISWEEACKYEKLYIKKFGRKDTDAGNLLNMTDGGDGIPGFVFKTKRVLSEETKRKISNSNKGKKRSAEVSMKLSLLHKGRRKTEEQKRFMSEKMKGRTHTPEAIEKMSLARKGKKLQGQHLQRVREANISLRKGKPLSDELKKRLSKIRMGKKLSLETRQKMSKPKAEKARVNMANYQRQNSGIIILNTETGIFYNCLYDAAQSVSMEKRTLWAQIKGNNRNKTSLIYV